MPASWLCVSIVYYMDVLLLCSAKVPPSSSFSPLIHSSTHIHTHTHSGFGFVVYEQKHEAEAAISRMDNAELDGRTIRVNFARPRYVCLCVCVCLSVCMYVLEVPLLVPPFFFFF